MTPVILNDRIYFIYMYSPISLQWLFLVPVKGGR